MLIKLSFKTHLEAPTISHACISYINLFHSRAFNILLRPNVPPWSFKWQVALIKGGDRDQCIRYIVQCILLFIESKETSDAAQKEGSGIIV